MVHISLATLTIMTKQTTSSRPPTTIKTTAEKSRQNMLQKGAK
jgi:hypothetical protein